MAAPRKKTRDMTQGTIWKHLLAFALPLMIGNLFQQLYNTAADFAALTGGETLIDLYCGAGTIGLSMAHKVKQLIGVEIIPEAVINAEENARLNGLSMISSSEDIDSVEEDAMFAMVRRYKKYNSVIQSLYCSFPRQT